MGAPVDNGAALSVPRTDTFPFCPAAAGNEWLLPDTFKGAYVDELKIPAVTFSIELGGGQAAGNLLATLHDVSIECLLKPRCTARVYIRMHFSNVPDMVTELHRQIPEKPGVLEFPDTGR
jgi:hypothetical protein